MRFSTVLVSFVAAAGFVAAQSSSSTTSTVPVPTTSYDKKTAACLDGCPEDNVNCRAACFGNPHPDENAVNATTQCAMKCVQGDGTEEQTKKYADCQQKCITQNFLTVSGSNPQSTAKSSTSSGAGSKETGDAKSDSDSTNENGETTDSKDEANKDDTKDEGSGAGKLAASAGGAIALALVAFAL
jgi:hypothetical protein